ncbi:hypothetical protein PFISCL1PPCAC_25595, partial [Pristionchus fissidentatus]
SSDNSESLSIPTEIYSDFLKIGSTSIAVSRESSLKRIRELETGVNALEYETMSQMLNFDVTTHILCHVLCYDATGERVEKTLFFQKLICPSILRPGSQYVALWGGIPDEYSTVIVKGERVVRGKDMYFNHCGCMMASVLKVEAYRN